MEIRVNGQLAALKKGTSFEYVAENRLFSGSDGYTLSITFPLRNCKQNIDIFGHINRADVIAGKVIFDCEIRDRSFYKFGSITITEINDAEVKTQFLEGRSEQNFDNPFDDIYINELTLGSGEDCDDSTPTIAWYPVSQKHKCVALPWVNDYSGNIQNLAEYHPEERNSDGTLKSNAYYSWHADCTGRSWQPYLLYITKEICKQVGYTADFSKWEADERYKYLLICNTLPRAWYIRDFARALPHWSVAEYFEKLELFLGGEFTINHRAKTIDFDFTTNIVGSLSPVELTNVIDEHSVEVAAEHPQCEYSETKNLVYKEAGHEMWKFYSCDWFIKSRTTSILRYSLMSELLAAVKKYATWDGSSGRNSIVNNVFYAEDVDCYFILRSLTKTLVQKYDWRPNAYSYKMELRPINIFGGRIVDESEDADEIEIEFVPAWVDETEDKYGRLLFLGLGSTDETTSSNLSFGRDVEDHKKEADEEFLQPRPFESIVAGEKAKKAEYFDNINIGWWNGDDSYKALGRLPHPFVEDIEVSSDFSGFINTPFSLRLNNIHLNRKRVVHQIDTKQKKTFKFLSESIPNPRAVFFIRGKKYLCEKLTATFTENGMLQLIKGIFYPVI